MLPHAREFTVNHCLRTLLLAFSSSVIFSATLASAAEEAPGLIANAFVLNQSVSNFADIKAEGSPSWSSVDGDINITRTSALQNWSQGGSIAPLYVRWSGTIKAPKDGTYKFFLVSDDGSRLSIGEKPVVDNDGLHGPSEKAGELELKAGDHPILIEYFNNSGDAAIIAGWQAPEGKKQVIPANVLFHDKGLEPPKPVAPEFKIAKGQHISIVGNTLAERMQHDGWLETLLQSRFKDHELVVRDLGFSADALTMQLRVDGFGSQDDWLTRTKADVVFAMFGFNESFAGVEGLDGFKTNLTRFIQGIHSKKYNGQTAPAVVLFSPIAHENLKDRNLPDGTVNNERLQKYVTAMAEVAEAQKVKFVDLFTPTLEAYKTAQSPLTINGIHLNTAGNQFVAGVIDKALFGELAAPLSPSQLEPLRQAVLDKNFYFFHRYQTTDGYNVHGGRSGLSYNGISNLEVMQREMEILDAMAANRDRKIWAVANGSDLTVDDSNTPEFIPVKTNFPGTNPDGSHVFLGGVEAISKMKVGEGMQVGLFASEEQFPELINPVQMSFDTAGRLFVCAWPSYPHWKPKDQMNDKLLILVDKDNDGKADECKTFADKLHNPTGFEFWNGGVIVAMAPDILFLKDTDGDDKADVRIRMLHGISSGDTHHAANSFTFDGGGALYFQEGVFHRTQIETPHGPQYNRDGCVWRFEPRTMKVERYVPYGFANPHGHVFDAWGQGFVHDGTGAVPFHETLFSGHTEFPNGHGGAPQLYNQRTRPCPATEILSSRHFPDEMQGNLLVENVIGFQGILQYKLNDKDSSFVGVEAPVILESSDRSFRPVDLEIAPDGSLYLTDWQNPIVGHMQHHIRDPNRDQLHGRVYRITYPSRPLVEGKKIAGEPIEKLLDLLKEPENRVRYRAKLELSARPSDEVIAATNKWVAGLDKQDSNYEHHRLEALWVHQHHNVANPELLGQVLRSPEFRARAAATRTLCDMRDQFPNALELLKVQVNDEHPRVRLEAVRACSYFQAGALDVAVEALNHPMDPYLEYTLNETTRAIEKYSK
jgi:lysophospholipase L1-like esterase/glucose/arabinose dehydrogenase